MKEYISKFLKLNLLFVLVFALFESQGYAKKRAGKKGKVSDKNKIYEVLVESSKKELVTESISVGGILNPSKMSFVVAYRDGVVTKIYKNAGEKVKKGEKLFVIEPQSSLDSYSNQIITARTSGILAKIDALEGEYVSKNQKLALVTNEKSGEVRFTFNSEDKKHLKNIKSVDILTQSSEAGDVKGELKSYNRVVDEGTLSYSGRLFVSCAKSCLGLYGEFLNVELVKNSNNLIVVPSRAVNQYSKTVTTVDANNKILLKTVELLPLSKERVAILSGLDEGEKVVLSSDIQGWAKLANGDQVVIKNESLATKKPKNKKQ